MKSILFLLTIAGTSAQAADALYCKVNGRAINALVSENPSWSYSEACRDPLLTGEVCFTGARKPILERLNSKDRVGSDEEWIQDAKYNGRNLQYTVIDGPNELSHEHIIKRCTPAFFTNSTQEQLPLFPDIEIRKDLEGLKAYLEAIDVGNGSSDTRRYNTNSIEREVSKLISSYEEATAEGEDPYQIEVNIKSASEDLIHWQNDVGERPETVKEDFSALLKRMVKEKNVLRILSITPAESCDESESCRWISFEIFLIDGSHINLSLDYTT